MIVCPYHNISVPAVYLNFPEGGKQTAGFFHLEYAVTTLLAIAVCNLLCQIRFHCFGL